MSSKKNGLCIFFYRDSLLVELSNVRIIPFRQMLACFKVANPSGLKCCLQLLKCNACRVFVCRFAVLFLNHVKILSVVFTSVKQKKRLFQIIFPVSSFRVFSRPDRFNPDSLTVSLSLTQMPPSLQTHQPKKCTS